MASVQSGAGDRQEKRNHLRSCSYPSPDCTEAMGLYTGGVGRQDKRSFPGAVRYLGHEIRGGG